MGPLGPFSYPVLRTWKESVYPLVMTCLISGETEEPWRKDFQISSLIEPFATRPVYKGIHQDLNTFPPNTASYKAFTPSLLKMNE